MNDNKPKTGFHIEHWHVIALFLLIYDIVAVNISYLAALLVRFDFVYSLIPRQYLAAFLKTAPIYTVFCIVVFWCLRMYRFIWRFASYNELLRIIISSVITTVFQVGYTLLFVCRMPVSYYAGGAVLQFILVLGIRFSYRFVLLFTGKTNTDPDWKIDNIMLIGAGKAGQMILRDIKIAPEVNGKVRCIIDDNPNKWGRFIDGIPVVGGREEILANVEKYHIDKIYVAIPSATAEERRDILNICKESGCELKNLPGMYQLMTGEIDVKAMKDVAIEDLLGREPIKVDMTEIFEYLTGKVILVTGGGGSIGSELCRQIAKHNPKQLIIFDIYENNAYDIQQELKREHPDLNLVTLIGSVRDSRRIAQVFETYKPDVVYHAAAHKHVPLMEDSPNEAIKNNVFGTYKTAYAAMMNGCQRFVLVSTDKAVNPTNIMGASKRMCEMIIQAFDQKIKENKESELPVLHVHIDDELSNMLPFVIPGQDNLGHRTAQTEFVAVRFGNVLGSNGSVIPLFKKQIATTGVVTVTHPDIIRYFMTIPEAVSLILQAGTYAKGGEIFVLDMGAPVKIDTLARNLIKLSGLKPDVDVKIVYTGLRPGEKLYEEKLMAEEGMQTTPNKLIHIGNPIPFDTDGFLGNLEKLMNVCYENDDSIRDVVQSMVSTYHPAGRQGSEAKGEVYQQQVSQIKAN